jgi:adenylate cyclase
MSAPWQRQRQDEMTETPPNTSAWIQREGAAPVMVTGNCSLGRVIGNDVVLVDDRVSRRHATIHAQGEMEFWLIDLGSRNGTYLNGRRISQPTRLHDSDRLHIGPFALIFRQPSAAATTRGAPAPASEQTQMDLRSASCWLLLCDIIGSSVLAREKSKEELAVLVGTWFGRCKEVLEDHGGVINKYLGDGLLAYWLSRAEAVPHVAQALRDLQRVQEEASPPFRLIVHHGDILLGGMPSSGEESLSGSEVNFVFRLERLASDLQIDRLASEAVVRQMGEQFKAVPRGDHLLHGFEGRFVVYSF